MADKLLNVGYKSQWDADSQATNNNCGPASATMILNSFGENIATDDFYKRTGATSGLITIPQIQAAIASYGYKSAFEINVTTDRLKSLIDQGVPVIALVHMGDLNSRQDKGYSGGHFLDVIGYRDDGYFVNDPDFWEPYREDGHNHFYTKTEFENAWKNCFKDENPVNSLIIIQPKNPVFPPTPSEPPANPADYPLTQMTRNVTVITDRGINVRLAPKTDGTNIAKVFPKGASLAVEGYVHGETVDGNDIWWKLKGENLYAWSGATNFVPTPPPSPAPSQPPATDIPPVDNLTREELLAKVTTLEDENKRVVNNGIEKDRFAERLKEELLKAQTDLSIVNQKVGIEEALRNTNSTLMEVNGELKQQRDEAFIKAFAGWALYAIPQGPKGLLKSPLFIVKILGLALDSVKHPYVIGWAKDKHLYKEGEGPSYDSTVAKA